MHHADHMASDDIPDVFREAFEGVSFGDLDDPDEGDWRPPLPAGLTDVLEVADATLSFGRMVHLVGDPSSPEVAYTHVALQRGLLGMRIYFPARPVPNAVGIAAYVIGFRDMPEVRRMYEVERVLGRLDDVPDARSAYGQAVSAATVRQAVRGLIGLARLEALPFALFPLQGA